MQQLLIGLLLLFFGSNSLLAQTSTLAEPFGSYVDLDGQILESYIDQDYTTKRTFVLSNQSPVKYLEGTYYTQAGDAVKGQLFYNTSSLNTLSYRAEERAKKSKIDLKDLKAFTIGTDSFIVASNFSYYGASNFISTMPHHRPLKHVASTEKFTFYEYQSVGKGNLCYLVSGRHKQELVALPYTNKLYLEKLPNLFEDYPELTSLLQKKKALPDHVGYLIRFIEYTDAAKANKTIGYTATWEPTDNPKKQSYYARLSRDSTHWKLDFFNSKAQKLFTEHYRLAEPGMNDGLTSWYHPGTDTPRKTRNYIEGTADLKYNLYHTNGQLHYIIIINEYDEFNNEFDENDEHLFQQVYTSDGHLLLDENGNGQEEYWDSISKRNISREFENHKLVASYYTDQQNRKIYQYTRKNAALRSLQKYNISLTKETYPEAAITAAEEGLALVKLVITPEGDISDYRIIQGISKSLDSKALELLKRQGKNALKCKAGKYGKEKVLQEVVVAFRFSLKKQTIHRNYYHDPYWMNPAHQPFTPPVSPPSMPGF